MRMRAKVIRRTPGAIQQVEVGEALALRRIQEPAGRRTEQTRGVIGRVTDAVERGKLRSASHAGVLNPAAAAVPARTGDGSQHSGSAAASP
jgi:hypothetical protein